jgi:hypothetical protein
MTPFSSLPIIPKTVTGFHRRFKADTKRIAIHENYRGPLFLIRSWTLLQAKGLGEARLVELLRKLGLSKRSPSFLQHRLLAENTVRLLPYAARLPHDIRILCRLAELQEEVLHHFIVCHGNCRNMTLDDYLRYVESSKTIVGRFNRQASGVVAHHTNLL